MNISDAKFQHGRDDRTTEMLCSSHDADKTYVKIYIEKTVTPLEIIKILLLLFRVKKLLNLYVQSNV